MTERRAAFEASVSEMRMESDAEKHYTVCAFEGRRLLWFLELKG